MKCWHDQWKGHMPSLYLSDFSAPQQALRWLPTLQPTGVLPQARRQIEEVGMFPCTGYHL